jgi:hypothetical protein
MNYITNNPVQSNAEMLVGIQGGRASAVRVPRGIFSEVGHVGVTVLTGRDRFVSDNKSCLSLLIDDLEDKRYKLTRPIPVVLVPDGDDYVLMFVEAEIATSGSTAHEALQWLKRSIVELYKLFKEKKKLGPLPRMQLKVLESYLAKEPHSAI